MRILLIIFCTLTLFACQKEQTSLDTNNKDENKMGRDILLTSSGQWDAKQTLEIYESSSFKDTELVNKLKNISNQGNLGAEVVLLKFQQDQAMKKNSTVDLFENEFYELGLKGQSLAASYAASSILEVDHIKDIKNLDKIIKIQQKLLETGIIGGVVANFPFYISLLLFKEDESSKIG